MKAEKKPMLVSHPIVARPMPESTKEMMQRIFAELLLDELCSGKPCCMRVFALLAYTMAMIPRIMPRQLSKAPATVATMAQGSQLV